MPDDFRERLDETAIRVLDLFEATGVNAVIIGGVAAGFLAEPRLTQDVDATAELSNEDLERFYGAAAALGLQPRRTDHIEFAKRSRMVLLVDTRTDMGVDISMAITPFEMQAIARPLRVELAGRSMPVVSVEDFAVMKAFAHRPHDLQDLRALFKSHPEIRLAEVRDALRQFADAADDDSILEDFERIVCEVLGPGR